MVAADASPTWRSLEHGLDLLKKGVISRIGNGENTRIWGDNWLPREGSLKPSGSTRLCRLQSCQSLDDER